MELTKSLIGQVLDNSGSDDQDLSLSGTTLNIEDGVGVDFRVLFPRTIRTSAVQAFQVRI